MKKSLLAVAVAAALPAFAHAQSSITLYGVADVGIEYSNDDANASAGGRGDSGVRLRDGTQTPSRFGIRGVEDLGGGLRAVFNIENRFSIDTGSTTGGGSVDAAAGGTRFWNGIAIVGLEGGWGRLTLGRNYTPIFYAIQGNDYSSYTMYNNWAGYTFAPNVASPIPGGSVQGPIRADNQIQYRSPTFGGLTLWATYAPGENLGGPAAPGGPLPGAVAGSGDLYGIALGWQLGGLYIAGGYHSFDVTPTVPAAAVLEDIAVITAGYRFSSFGLSVGYSQQNFAQVAGGSPSVETIFGSAFLNLGRGQLIANVHQVETSGFAAATTVRNTDGLQWGLSYLLPLSKRTSTYITYGQNDYSPSSLAPAGAAGLVDSATRVAVGIRHNF